MNRARTLPPPPPPAKRSFAIPLVAMAIALVVFLGVIAIVATRGGDDDDDAGDAAASAGLVQVAPVEVDGADLPPLTGGDDPAIGEVAPTLEGVSFDGTPVVVEPDGRPKLVVFLAHWCPHCQREVPVLVQWMADGGVPEGMDVVGVATATDPRRDNYPPSAWLEREDWPTPVLADSSTFRAAQAYGLSAYPFMVALKADGTVAARTSGELTTDQLDALVGLATA